MKKKNHFSLLKCSPEKYNKPFYFTRDSDSDQKFTTNCFLKTSCLLSRKTPEVTDCTSNATDKAIFKTIIGNKMPHLAAEGAGILGMLADFNLLHHFP